MIGRSTTPETPAGADTDEAGSRVVTRTERGFMGRPV